MRIVKAALVGLSPKLEPPVRELLAERCVIPGPAFGSAAEACEALRPDPAERLLFVHRVAPGGDPGQVTLLADRFPGRPILGLVPGDAPAGAALAINRAGAAQVVRTPPDPEDFGAALDRISLMFFGAASRSSRVLAVSGVVGGCGATTLAVNLASEARLRRGGRVLLAETGGRIGGLSPHLGLEPRHTAADLLRAIERADAYLLKQALTPVSDGVAALPAPVGAVAPRATPEQMRAVLGLARSVADLVVLDVGCATDEGYFDVLSLCDGVLLVGDQEAPSVRALMMICGELSRRPGRARPLVGLNRYRGEVGAVECGRLAGTLGVPRVIPVAEDARAAREALRRGVPIRSAARRSRALAGLGEICEGLLPDREAAPPVARRGLLARWLGVRHDAGAPAVPASRIGRRAGPPAHSIEPIRREDLGLAFDHGA